MANRGWMINLTGNSIPVYSMLDNGAASNTQISNITKNECFTEGTAFGANWEGVDFPFCHYLVTKKSVRLKLK